MADDDDKPPRGVLARVFDKLTHKHPPPKLAAPAFIRTEWVPAAPAPGGGTPARTAAPQRPDRAAVTAAPAEPAEDPARVQLEQQAEARRADLAKIERDCREGQRRAHADRAELLAERHAGVDRLAVEQEQRREAAGNAAEVATLDEYFAMRWASTDAAIATAFEVGHFTDAWANAEARAEARVAEHDAGRGDDAGGRGLGD